MVWSQYIADGNHGTEVDPDESDEILYADDDELTIHDWETYYSDDIRYIWDMMKILIRDAWLEYEILHQAEYWEFVEFCFEDRWDRRYQHNSINIIYRDKLYYIWKKINEYVQDNELQDEFFKGATFSHFMSFIQSNSMGENNIII
jgi:hypothetical protein|tara:strand:+ start:4620 stop:5057 length:438 start_codon:yes stop_codon:yes gene_type:complete